MELQRKLHDDLLQAEIRLIEASSEFEVLAEENSRVQAMLNQRRKDVHETEQEYTRLHNDAKALLEESRRIFQTRTTEEEAIHAELGGGLTIAELNSEIESVTTRLDLMSDGNPNAIREFEKRARDIEAMQKKLDELTGNLVHMQENIDLVRAKWEPQLDALVFQISDGFSKNFEKIGCAGQVSVHKDEDFDQWSIQIQVRFR